MKKVLFVCRGNVGRSQAAEALYNHIYPNQASSAGTAVDIPGQKLRDRPGARNVVKSMKKIGIDIANRELTQLTEEMLNDFDEVVVMAEPDTIPNYLKENPKFVFWDVDDMKGKDLEETIKLRDQIKQLIHQRLV